MPIDPNDVTWEKPFSAVNPSEVKWDKPFTPVGGNSDTSPPVFVDDYGRNIGDRPRQDRSLVRHRDRF